jgi:hypothetical protein
MGGDGMLCQLLFAVRGLVPWTITGVTAGCHICSECLLMLGQSSSAAAMTIVC